MSSHIIPKEDIPKIKRLYLSGFSQEKIAKKYNVCRQAIGKYVVNMKPRRNRFEIIPKNISEELAEAAGIFAGDGTLWKQKKSKYLKLSIRICGNPFTEKLYYKWIKNLFESLFNITVIPKMFNSGIHGNGTYGIEINSSKIGLFFHKELEFPIGKKSRIVKMPSKIMKNDLFVKAFIRGLFDTDGNLYANNSTHTFYIKFKQASKELIKQVRNALLKFGFRVSNISEDMSGYKPPYFYIRSCGKKQIEKFYKLMGSNNPNRIKKFEVIINGNN